MQRHIQGSGMQIRARADHSFCISQSLRKQKFSKAAEPEHSRGWSQSDEALPAVDSD